MRRHIWTEAEIRGLGVRTDLVTACSIVYGCGATKAYELVARDEIDFPVRKVGNRYAVPVAPLLELLGLPVHMSEPEPASPDIATNSTTEEEADAPKRTLPAAV
jgi:hypothetical protein